MFTHPLLPIDGSDLSDRAAQTSLALAAQRGARITAFVAEPGEQLFGSRTKSVLSRSKLPLLVLY